MPDDEKDPEQQVRIDPRDFISGPFAICPQCGSSEFGSLMVTGRVHARRCRACWHTERVTLPPLKKKVVYIDQMALSNMAKELDAEWQERIKRPDPFWLDVYDQLERLVKLQVLVCPHSPTHEEESSFDDRTRGVLQRLYHHLSGEVRFKSAEEIRSRQMYEAQKAYIAGQSPNWSGLDPKDATRGSLTEWTDRISIRANVGDLRTVEERREHRENLRRALEAVWAGWVERKPSLETVFEEERRAYGEASLMEMVKLANLHAEAQEGRRPSDIFDLMPGPMVRGVMGIRSRFEEAGAAGDEALRRTLDFFDSENALDAPQNRLRAMLLAALGRRASSGQKRPPNRGTANDIEVISSYLPYCEAMFVDNEMAQLLAEEPLATEVAKYKTKVFSTRNRDEFLAYLEDMEAVVPDDHVDLVRKTYGDSWLTGYRSILEHERRKSSPGRAE